MRRPQDPGKRDRHWATSRDLDADIDEEFRIHVEMRVEENLARGMTPAAARAEAERRMGDVGRWKGETREVEMRTRQRRRIRDRMDLLRQGLSQAARSLLRRPGFTIPTVLALALGIGAATAGFAVLDAIVLRPLPYARADRLVWVDSPVPGQGAGAAWGLSVAGYFEFREEATSLEEIGAYGASEISLTGDEGAFRLRAASVTADALDALSARPALGRLIEDEDDDPDAAVRGVVLSWEFWRRAFGSDPDVLGRTVRIEDEPSVIIGVMERGFHLPEERVDVWVPLSLDPTAPAVNSHWVAAVGRLAPDATLDGAQAELDRITARFPELFPGAYSPEFMEEYGFRTRVRPLAEHVVGSDVERSLWIVVAAVGLVLLVACANVANLLLVRAEARRRESALRAALGATRSRIAAGTVTESLVLTLAGAAAGIGLAKGALWLLISTAPPGLPRAAEVGVGPLATAFAAGLALVLGLVLGGLPALGEPVRYGAIRDGAIGVTPARSRHRIRKAIVMAQVALSVVLLTGAGLMVRSVLELRKVDPGFEPGGAVAFELSLPRGPYREPEAAAAFAREITGRLEALPGVRSAGVGEALPLGGVACAPVRGEDQAPDPGQTPPCTDKQQVSPGFFSALGIGLVRGRAPTWTGLDAGAGEAVVTETLARRLWPGQDPIGKGIRPSGTAWYRVVGVTAPLRSHGLDAPPAEVAFYPLVALEGANLWGPLNRPTVVVRTAGPAAPGALVPAIERILGEVEPAVPLGSVETLRTHVATSPSMVRRSFMMTLMGVVGGLALLLSIVGIYGVVSYVVGQRTVEMGVRLALGARMGQVAAMVLRDSLLLASGGIALGLLGAVAFSRSLGSLLFGISPVDPATLVGVALLLLALSLAATWVPARRATRIDPARSLRAD